MGTLKFDALILNVLKRTPNIQAMAMLHLRAPTRVMFKYDEIVEFHVS